MSAVPQPGKVEPGPSPVSWELGVVGSIADGEKIILVRVDLITGPTFIYLPASAARLLAEQLIEHAAGLTLATEIPK